MAGGVALANASADDRRESDFYPTPPEVTIALLEWLDLPDPAIDNVVWEPACGDGAMTAVLRGYGFNVMASDIRTDGVDPLGGAGIDFLAHDSNRCGKAPHWVITNPPFNLAEDFIRRALGITPNVAMLLKSQFWHAASRAKLFGEHPPAAILPLTWRPDFLDGDKGGAPTMECLWTVWGGAQVRALQGLTGATLYQPLMRPSGTRQLL